MVALLLNVELETSKISSLGALLKRVENLDEFASTAEPASRRLRMRRVSKVEDNLY